MGPLGHNAGSSEGVFAASPDRVAALLDLGISVDGETSAAGNEQSHASGDDAPPDVPGYRITGRLGEGGMGTVWQAVQLSTRREVALKLVAHAAAGSRRVRLRFDREVELAARLEDPHIARVYDSGMSRGLYYYAMELVEGRHLDAYVREEKLHRRQVLALFRDVCLAVQHAHQNGVIHRDLKPSNILVTRDGVPKVVDFGLARALNDDAGHFTQTMVGQCAGTPAFMAPEQAAGDSHRIDTRTDVWGLGATLYLLLTGRPPHDTHGPRHAVLRRVAEQDVRRPRHTGHKLGTELDAILLQALAREQDRRYDSAGALGRDVQRYLSGWPVAARPPSPAYVLRKWVARHRVAIAFTLLMCAVVAGSGGYVRHVLRHAAARQAAAMDVHRQRGYAEGAAVAGAIARASEVNWVASARMYDAILAAGGATDMDRSGCALVHLALGRDERYRELCREMLTNNRGDADAVEVTLACAMRPDSVQDWLAVARLTDAGLAQGGQWRQLLKGMVEYRLNRCEQSLPWLNSLP